MIGRQLNELNLPSGSSIGAIVRDKQVLIAHHDLIIETDDHVILFMIDKTQIEEVERLFEVKLGFF